MQISVELKVPNVPLFDPAKAQAVMAEETRSFMNGAVLMFQGAIVPLAPINVGALRQSIQTSVTGTNADITGRVFSPLAYAVPVEEGSRPHWPPPGPILLWVTRKLGKTGAEARSVAFLVARKISRQGTPAFKFFARGIAATTPRVEALWASTGARIVKRLGGS